MFFHLLSTHWTNLLVVNFETDKNFLKQFLPSGTELNDWNGKYILSLVGFEFSKTKILGIPSPIFRQFAELNIRFYVKRKVADSWRKGVVFMKEIAPHKLIGKMAGWLYKENFITLPIKASIKTKRSTRTISYQFMLNGNLNFLRAETEIQPTDIIDGTIEHFIYDHYYAYTRLNETTTKEFKIEHRPWKIHKAESVQLNLDIASIYGKEFETYLNKEPLSTFLMDGSETKVTWPVTI